MRSSNIFVFPNLSRASRGSSLQFHTFPLYILDGPCHRDNMTSVIKDTGEIWSRLFVHRPFVNGEISYFVREFEEKRGDREVERLFKILEYSTELGQSQIDRAEQLGDCHLPSLKANTDVALSMCDRIITREKNFDSNIKLAANREARKEEWRRFINDMSDKCQRVDETFTEKEEELKEFYIDLEKKLHINP